MRRCHGTSKWERVVYSTKSREYVYSRCVYFEFPFVCTISQSRSQILSLRSMIGFTFYFISFFFFRNKRELDDYIIYYVSWIHRNKLLTQFFWMQFKQSVLCLDVCGHIAVNKSNQIKSNQKQLIFPLCLKFLWGSQWNNNTNRLSWKTLFKTVGVVWNLRKNDIHIWLLMSESICFITVFIFLLLFLFFDVFIFSSSFFLFQL